MKPGPTAGSPAPAGAGPRRVALNVVITETLDVPVSPSDFDLAVAAGVRAVLKDNGYAVKVELATADPAVAWPMWARQLDALLTEVAAAERAATVAHAEAYLAAEGTQQYRTAAADLAAAAAVESHATLAGRAEAFRMVLSGQAGRDALTATEGEPAMSHGEPTPAERAMAESELDAQLERILRAAMRVARNAPAKRGTNVSHAKVYWPLITELRAALTSAEIDWRG